MEKCRGAGSLAEALRHNVNGVKTVAPMFGYNDWNTKVLIPQGSSTPDKLFKKQDKIIFADAGYFELLPHKWLAGSPAASLKSPYSLVLTESRARRYFPNVKLQDILGRSVVFSDTNRTTVTGIVTDLEHKSDFQQSCFISLNTIYNTNLKVAYQADKWGSTNSANQILVLLQPGVKAETVNKQIETVFKAHIKQDPAKTGHHLQALADIHTNPEYGGTVDPAMIRNLTLLAVFLLAIGAINFINLTTAHASERAKEVGIRKTLGSSRGRLIAQFLAETFFAYCHNRAFIIRDNAAFASGIQCIFAGRPQCWLFV